MIITTRIKIIRLFRSNIKYNRKSRVISNNNNYSCLNNKLNYSNRKKTFKHSYKLKLMQLKTFSNN